MVVIAPLRGIHYDPRRVDPSRVLCEPYDKIDAAARRAYAESDPHNAVRLVLPEDPSGGDPYAESARLFESWLASGVLVRDDTLCIYPYHQDFLWAGRSRTRRGFIALAAVEKPGHRWIFPHEETLSAPRADRLRLLEATGAHFGQIFLLYSDPEGQVNQVLETQTAGPPLLAGTGRDGTFNRLWAVSDREAIAAVTVALEKKKVVIADGHHRFETAWEYRERRRLGEGDAHYYRGALFRMATFVAAEDPGLVVLPTHRLLSAAALPEARVVRERLDEHFARRDVHCAGDEELERVLEDVAEDLRLEGYSAPCMAMVRRGEDRLTLLAARDPASLAARIPDGDLDVVLLHRVVLGEALGLDPARLADEGALQFLRESREAVCRVRSGAAEAAFLLNPTPVSRVMEKALARRRLPPKSTDFYPKLASGILINRVE